VLNVRNSVTRKHVEASSSVNVNIWDLILLILNWYINNSISNFKLKISNSYNGK